MLSSVNSSPADLRIQILCLPCLSQTLTNSMKASIVAIITDGRIEVRCYHPCLVMRSSQFKIVL